MEYFSERRHCEHISYLQAHPSSPSQESKTLKPGLLLPRSCLPLAYLDLTHQSIAPSESTLFVGLIKALENELPGGWPISPLILVAQSLSDNQSWVIERVQRGTYALSRLCDWVTLKGLKRLIPLLPDSGSAQERRPPGENPEVQNEWWHTATTQPRYTLEQTSDETCHYQRVGGISLCLQKPILDVLHETQSAKQIPAIEASQNTTTLDAGAGEHLQRSAEVLEMVRKQYREALYASKVGIICSTIIIYVVDNPKDSYSLLREGSIIASAGYL